MPVKLSNLHEVTKRLADGRVAIYCYRGRDRGARPLMTFYGGNLAEARKALAAGAEELAAAYLASKVGAQPTQVTLGYVVTRFRAAKNGFGKLADSTKKQWSRWLDVIVEDFGTLPVKALNGKGAKTLFVDWRDKWAETPRKGDYAIQVLSRVLSFGQKSGLIDANPVKGIETIYRNDRSDLIVEDHELTAVLSRVTVNAAFAIRVSAGGGMRAGDLCRLKWADVTDVSIEFDTSKSGETIRSIVPLYGDLRAVIAELRVARDGVIAAGKIPSPYLLTTMRGGKWAEGSLSHEFGKAAKALGVDRHLNDLRGTAATRFIQQGLSDEQVALILGWDTKRVTRIRQRYVNRGRVVQSLVDQLERDVKTR